MTKNKRKDLDDVIDVIRDVGEEFEQAAHSPDDVMEKTLTLMRESSARLAACKTDETDILADVLKQQITSLEKFSNLTREMLARFQSMTFFAGFELGRSCRHFADIIALSSDIVSKENLAFARTVKRLKTEARQQAARCELQRRLDANKRLTKTAALKKMAGEKEWGSLRQLQTDCKGINR